MIFNYLFMSGGEMIREVLDSKKKEAGLLSSESACCAVVATISVKGNTNPTLEAEVGTETRVTWATWRCFFVLTLIMCNP